MGLSKTQAELLDEVRWMCSGPDPFTVEVTGQRKRTARSLEKLGLVVLSWDGVGSGPWEVTLPAPARAKGGE